MIQLNDFVLIGSTWCDVIDFNGHLYALSSTDMFDLDIVAISGLKRPKTVEDFRNRNLDKCIELELKWVPKIKEYTFECVDEHCNRVRISLEIGDIVMLGNCKMFRVLVFDNIILGASDSDWVTFEYTDPEWRIVEIRKPKYPAGLTNKPNFQNIYKVIYADRT